MEDTKNYLFLSSFSLKIIGLILMTLSHIGVFLSFSNNSSSEALILIGQGAFPIFVFLALKAIFKSKNLKNYIFRLLIMSLIIYLGITISSFIFPSYNTYLFGNIFIDLVLYSLIAFIFNLKAKWKYLLYLPIVIFYIVTYLIKINIIDLSNSLITYQILGGLFPQYSIFGLLVFLIPYISYQIYDKRVDKIDPSFKESKRYQLSRNTLYCISVAILGLLSYSFTYIREDFLGIGSVNGTYIVISLFFLFFYNGKVGINNKITKSIFYSYYPLHLLLLLIIFQLI